jgi:hypothetical protein
MFLYSCLPNKSSRQKTLADSWRVLADSLHIFYFHRSSKDNKNGVAKYYISKPSFVTTLSLHIPLQTNILIIFTFALSNSIKNKLFFYYFLDVEREPAE